MLILNGKFPITNLLTVLLALLLAFGAANAHVAEVKAGARAPDAVASEFYGWYLDTLSADQDPLSDRYDIFSRYVAKELSARLIERLQGGKLPQRDYFTQSGSYRVAWQRKRAGGHHAPACGRGRRRRHTRRRRGRRREHRRPAPGPGAVHGPGGWRVEDSPGRGRRCIWKFT
jgi:hypothetical protein